jgi:hypothetical protein
MDFEDKCKILADLWLNYRKDPDIEDFVEYNDLGLPLAFLIHAELVEVLDDGIRYVEEAYDLFAESLQVDPDEDFNTLQEMLNASPDEDEEE